MRFRKKPVVIDAMQFIANGDDVVKWAKALGADALCWSISATKTAIGIRTLEGEMRASSGDWIIRGVKGEFYPCKPDIFDATYRPCPWNGAVAKGNRVTEDDIN